MESSKAYGNHNKGIVSIALATDNNYLAPTLVAVKSIVLHASDDYDYSVYILSDNPLNIIEKRLFSSVIGKKKNVMIVFIAVGNRLGSVKLSKNGCTKGITQATYFRFLLPNLLNDKDKIIYMDADAIALDDIAKIYFYDMDDYYIGGVRDIVGYQDEESRCKDLDIASLDQYVNAGVLLMNLDELRKNSLADKMLRVAAERSFPYNDQDIINSVCYGKIKCLPCRCNVIVDYLEEPYHISHVLRIDYKEKAKHPIVLHYAGRAKPWYSQKGNYTLLWWNIVNSFNLCTALTIKYSARKLRLKSK